jgi:hypothetical protein
VEAWVRNLFILTVLFVWTIAVGASLIKGQLPEPILWGVPTTLWLAMNPPVLRRRMGSQSETTPKAE